jgi:hypothetical protein
MKMKRKKLIESLREVGSMTLDSKELEDVMPEVYEYFLEKFRGFVNDPHNTATEEELEAFQNGKYLVDIYFLPDKVTYTAGVDSRQLANEPCWGEDDYNDIEIEELQALLEVAKQG